MKKPRTGVPVRRSRTGRPIMALLDLLGRRWVLRICWELREGAAKSFRELQASCDMVSPTVLNNRLRELRDEGFVRLREENGYELTEEGRKLLKALVPLGRIANRRAR